MILCGTSQEQKISAKKGRHFCSAYFDYDESSQKDECMLDIVTPSLVVTHNYITVQSSSGLSSAAGLTSIMMVYANIHNMLVCSKREERDGSL